jgi:hypothetical protein
MGPTNFRLSGWESWTSDHIVEEAEITPAILRRRVTSLGRQALSSAWKLPETANARFILSSRHGEFSRTLSLLEAVIKRESLSPADFTLSVHHALIGLLSIVHHNHRGHTAVAAGRESFCFGLMEAIACLNENPSEQVVLVHFDEPLPGPFAAFNEPNERPIVLVLALTATGKGEALQMDIDFSPCKEKPSTSHAHDFLNFLTSGSISGLSIGEYRQWRWMRHALG